MGTCLDAMSSFCARAEPGGAAGEASPEASASYSRERECHLDEHGAMGEDGHEEDADGAAPATASSCAAPAPKMAAHWPSGRGR